MRKLGFAVLGLVLGAGLAVALAWPQLPGARAMDPQGMHLMGVIFVALPLGAVVGLVLGLLAERVLRR
jgi:hypothetical protein